MMQEKIVVDSPMRKAFAVAYNTASYSPLKRTVAKKLCTNRGRIFSNGWKVLRKKA